LEGERGHDSLVLVGLFVLIVAFGGSKTNDIPIPGQQISRGLTWRCLAFCWQSADVPCPLVPGRCCWRPKFPTDIRGRALGATTIITYLCASFVTKNLSFGSVRLGGGHPKSLEYLLYHYHCWSRLCLSGHSGHWQENSGTNRSGAPPNNLVVEI
jgi:hypothetical protein